MLVFTEIPSFLVILGGLLILIGVATAVIGKQTDSCRGVALHPSGSANRPYE
ncbi:hypothetical protein IQ238_19070 [Pleurocapsales cyanobacterium LEGE 06147]|nr:hypothetical protein [Pleurocapsales cyanobacterium LEGE 06147]